MRFGKEYNNTYMILERNNKTKLVIRGKEVTVSTDRVKPAYVMADEGASPSILSTPSANSTYSLYSTSGAIPL